MGVPLDPDEFTATAEWHNPSMLVVTTHHDSSDGGCLVGFHSQCSINPPRWAIWISRVNHTYPLIAEAEHVVLHFLREDQHELAEWFGSETGDLVDKFADLHFSRRFNVPVIDGCDRVFVCRRMETVDTGGDHVCLVLEPVESLTRTSHSKGTPQAEGPLRLQSLSEVRPGHPEQT